MHIQTFEDIIAWQKARVLVVELYKVFDTHKDYGFRDQVLRAGVSIMNNIAEGFDRGSSKELKQFLIIARGSAAEVRSMLIVSKDLGYTTDEQSTKLLVTVKDISKLLTGFVKSLN
jgi:four helix bundle protein